MMRWLSVVGIGDDGLAGLTGQARVLVDRAELLVGGERHQRMVAETTAVRLTWQSGIRSVMDELARWRGRPVVVLTTGDPMWFGAGARLVRHFPIEEMTILPHPGAFSLAAARLGWSLADTETITVHGRPLEVLNRAIQPGARLLIYSQDGDTPAKVATLLATRGFGGSRLTVLEHLGGPRERRIDGVAGTWTSERCADLNTIAVDCRAGPDAVLLPTAPGLADELFDSDGQLTKREARALTISALAPLPGEVLWDVGAGSGSIAIEWLRAAPAYRIDDVAAKAIAIERETERCAHIARNAATLGVPQLDIVQGEAPEALTSLPTPNRIFVGGGITREGVLDACWAALRPGGRMVANAVTIEALHALCRMRERCGGSLTRIAVSRSEPVGNLTTFRPLLDVVQFVAVKA